MIGIVFDHVVLPGLVEPYVFEVGSRLGVGLVNFFYVYIVFGSELSTNGGKKVLKIKQNGAFTICSYHEALRCVEINE